MEKLFISAVILYALFVWVSLFRMKPVKKRKKNIVGKGSSIHETRQLKTDIVGKSKFDRCHSLPEAATSKKTEKGMGNPNIFAPPNEAKPTAEVPQEELDKVFSDTPPDEDNAPMDIDYPLEYETDDENEDDPEEEEEEVEGVAGATLASGVPFEDLGNAVRTVNKTDEATPEQKQRAGDTLLDIRKTDMFEQVVSGKPDAKRIVSNLMAESLADFHRKKDKEAGNTGSDRKVPDSFNIRDFA